jgi:uncharacterized coiled-coil protein SlyX
VLGPEQREHGELEVVRATSEQLVDALEFSVGEAELTMERYRDPRQGTESNGGS